MEWKTLADSGPTSAVEEWILWVERLQPFKYASIAATGHMCSWCAANTNTNVYVLAFGRFRIVYMLKVFASILDQGPPNFLL